MRLGVPYGRLRAGRRRLLLALFHDGDGARLRDLEFLGQAVYMLHDVKTLDFDPQGRYRVVIAGHSHKPRNEWIGDVLYFNPGGAGPRRFTLPITVGRLVVNENGVTGEIIEKC